MKRSALLLSTLLPVFLLGWHSGLQADESETISVSVYDRNNSTVAVRSWIKTAPIESGQNRYFFSGETLVVSPESAVCKDGEAVIAVPENSALYFNSSVMACSESLSISVKPKSDYAYLYERGYAQAEAGDYGTAVLLYNEAAYRSMQSNDSNYKLISAKAYESAWVYFGLSDSASGHAKIVAMTPELEVRITEFQRDRGLQPTGKLDYQTVQEMSGKQIGSFLSQ